MASEATLEFRASLTVTTLRGTTVCPFEKFELTLGRVSTSDIDVDSSKAQGYYLRGQDG